MITNLLNYEKLRVKRDSLADESRLIRRRENDYRKWTTVLYVSNTSLEKNNYLEHLKSKGWEVSLVPPPEGRPGMSDEERAAYKAGKWARTAKVRKLNPRYNESIRYSLWSHRTNEVRNEARATHLAIAYMKGVPYSVVETPSLNPQKAQYRRPDVKSIWRLVQKYPMVDGESTEDIKHLENWLQS